MDQDPNDLLNTNVYIPIPEYSKKSEQENEEFKRYYEREKEQQIEKDIINKTNQQLTLKNKVINPVLDENNKHANFNNELNGNGNGNGNGNVNGIKRSQRERRTLVNVDSRDRNKKLYLKASNFKIFLGNYENVKQIKLQSMEFPNTDAVINSNNNRVYWRNKEDIDLDFTLTTNGILQYPAYTFSCNIGSYTASTLQTEIQNDAATVRRKQGASGGTSVTGNYHYFVVSLDITTDIVSLTSLILTQLPNNPLSATIGTGTIIVNAPNHGYSNNQQIYLTGATTFAGINANYLIGFFYITVLNSNSFSITVPINAGTTALGGGNTVNSGLPAPFQLLWGDAGVPGTSNTYTIAQNIGYPLENSSVQINTNISALRNIYQMIITTTTPHKFLNNYNYIGQIVQIGYYSGNIFIDFRNLLILNILSTTSFLVQVTDKTVATSLSNNNQATTIFINDIYLTVSSYENYSNDNILITTTTNHNYTLSDVNYNITLFNTSDPTVVNDNNYDGTYQILGVPSPTTLIVPGVLNNNNVHPSGNYGTIPRYIPLTTNLPIINSIEPNALIQSNITYTKINCSNNHNLMTGDTVTINNISSLPLFNENYSITVINSVSFYIPFQLDSYDTTNILLGLAYVGNGLISVSMPSHSFNNIINISNDITAGDILIQTTLPHLFNTGDSTRISNTNTSPNIDENYIVTKISNDTFKITATTLTNIPLIVTGIIGLNNNFYLYGATDVGGIPKANINGNYFSVRDILDINTFTFMINNVYCSSYEQGGGNSVFISSLRHGFSGTQTNTRNALLNRSINLEGENYAFLTCPQLNTMNNTGTVTNIFARITLSNSPGFMCFDFLSNPKEFDTVPLNKLSELEFSVVNYDGSYYAFNDLDFSFCLEITEVIDQTDGFNISSRRGIVDTIKK
jgi:hypothetical protein